MNEKTPFIVLTVVFVVGFVGLVMMMTEANTGAVSIYEATNRAAETPGGDPAKYWRIAAGGRAFYGGTVLNTEERKIRDDLGLPLTEEQAKDARLGVSGTVTDPTTGRSQFHQVTTNQRGCKVYGVARRLGQVGLQYPAGTPALRESIRMLECYMPGEETAEGEIPMVKSVIQNRPLTWDKVNTDGNYEYNTACCYSAGLKSTY